MTTTVLATSEGRSTHARAQRAQPDRRWEAAGETFTVTAGERNLSVVLLRNLEGLEALGYPWRALSECAAIQSGFLTWEWLFTWSQRFIRGNRRLFVLVVADGTKVIGIAPWYIDLVPCGPVRLRQIGFLGLPEAGSDYLDVITDKVRERVVAEALVALLFGPLSSMWDTLSLKDIPADSLFLSRFISQLRRNGKHYIVDEGSFCPGVQLPPTFDAYLTHLSSHGRQAYRRKMRALRSSGCVEHVILRGEEEVRFGLAPFRELYERRWGRSNASDDLFAVLGSYLSRAGAAWQVELSLLQVDGRAIAGLLHLTRGRTMYQYLMAIDRSFNRTISIGNLICGMNIERAIQAGFAEYDFLKSEEDYKFQFMTRGRRAMNVTLHNRTARSLVAWSVRAAQSLGKILLR